MADMSPEAVTQRLRLMDELWELSVALMNSKLATTTESSLEIAITKDREHDLDPNRDEAD